ncbi:SMC family ATPase [Sphingobacterium sp. SRCM116780]|uniref:AAA family ATPase n=1 Tax=Sphingobacterium sp. SRCM116780 TaxID=2907623 RepID=UPI001F1E5BF2|nr:SMC family ATPase [Sphingobacterium sp. SRCM116780]UIR57603.1 SMC family ATPase [Sphingobacterium sp. SRCM116780]
MLPLYLSIEGLYSYQAKQEIDFTSLTAAGLFGIFGKVGSGKSSILEAITFVLFGNTNRLNNNNRAYNMMNLNSNQLRIEFHFIGKENKKYAFEVSWKRNGKQFEKVTTPIRKAYIFENNEKVPLESTDAEVILGISYKNFNRTVIVPQGQFKEFLELKGSDRSSMMKELFNLDHYDLFYKVAILNKETELKLQNISGAVQTLEDYTEESIAGLLTQLEKEESNLSEVTKQHVQLDQHYQKLLEVQQLYQEIVAKKETFAKLSATQVDIEALKSKIQLFQKVERIFKNSLDNLAKDHKAEIQLQEDIGRAQQQLDTVNNALLAANHKFKQVEDNFNQLDNKKIEVEDLKNIVHFLQLQLDINRDNERLANGQLALQDVEKEILKQQTFIQEKQQEITKLKESRISSSLLISINDWYTKQELYVKSQEELQIDLVAKQKDLQAIRLLFEQENLDPTTWKEKLEQLETTTADRLEKLQEEENKVQVQQQLASYSHALTDGEACPLCGSEHHPHIMQTEDVSIRLNTVKSEKTRALATILEIQQQRQRLIQLATNLSNLQKDVDVNAIKLKTVSVDLDHHLKQFTWSTFQPHDREAFDQWRLQAAAVEQNCTTAETALTLFLNELEELKIKKEKYNKGLNNIALSKSAFEGSAASHQLLIKRLNLSDFKQFPIPNIENKIVQSLQSITHIEQEYKKLSDEINHLNITVATHSTTSKTLEMQLSTMQLKIESQQKLIAELLNEYSFESVYTVQQILQQQFDLDKEEARIRQFEEQFTGLKVALEQLEEKLKQETVDISQIAIVKQELQQAKEVKEKLIGQLQSLKDQLLVSQKRYAEKMQLQSEFGELTIRSKNLTVLSNLFKGNGFVDYISTQYLEDLCQIANQRFERLTRGHLKLMINQDNDFEVIDHLNGGKSRSVKTLSGGQFFQASLCLALALAESTRSLNQNEKNFFFIDEGFGTQDTDAVHLIFETLNTLHKENRIVGVISHVDELQERIPTAIKVTKDEEKGSLITRNF